MSNDETVVVRPPVTRRGDPARFRPVDLPLALIAAILAVTLVAAVWPRAGAAPPTDAPAATPTAQQVVPPAPQGPERNENAGKGKGEKKGKD